MFNKVYKSVLIPCAFSIVPVGLFDKELLFRPEVWAAYILGFITIVTQPNISYNPGSDFYHHPGDQRSALFINITIYFISILSVIIYLLSAFDDERSYFTSIFLFGAGLAALGITIRIWSIATLGRYFTATVKIREDHELITTGPYRILRHPSYTGAILMYTALPMLFLSFELAIFSFVALLAAYSYRIRIEEKLLLETFGPQYEQFKERTWKLFPCVW